MHKYFIVYNDVKNLDVGVWIDQRPSKPSPEMEYETVKVPGGKTLYREKGYNDIEITINMNFISLKPSGWDNQWRKIKKWLLSSGTQKLQFADDLEAFYKVNKVIINTPERILRQHGKFTVTFTCEPYTYIAAEEEEITTQLYNDFLLSKPIYRIIGQGELTININGKDIKINVGTPETIIDTDKGLVYRDGIIHNQTLTGNYEDMYLKPGENTFELTPTNTQQTFQVFVTPNWRVL